MLRGGGIVRELIRYIPSKVLPAAAGVLSIPLFTRLLTEAEYGKYIIVMTVLTIISTLFVSWLPSAILRFTNAKAYLPSTSAMAFTVVSLTFAFIAWTAWYRFEDRFKDEVSTLFYYGGIVWILTYLLLEYVLAYLRTRDRVRCFGLLISVRSMAGLIGGCGAIYLTSGRGEVLLSGIALYLFVISIPAMMVVDRNAFLGSHGGSKAVDATEIVRYGIPVAFSNLLILCLSILDRLIINQLLGAESVAIYSASYELSEKILFFINSWFTLSTSVIGFNKFDKDGPEEARKFLEYVLFLYMLFVIPVAMWLILIFPIANGILFPPSYSEGAKIGPYVIISSVLVGFMHRYSLVLSMHKEAKRITISTAFAVLCNVVLCVLLVKGFGLIGAAWATLIASLIWLIAIKENTSSFSPPKFPWSSLIIIMLSSIISALILYHLLDTMKIYGAILQVGVGSLLHFIVYALLIYFFRYRLPLSEFGIGRT